MNSLLPGPSLRGIAAIFALLAVAASPGCKKKLSPLETTKAFFALLAAGKVEEAYASTHFGFQALQTEKYFETSLNEVGLDAIESIDYTEMPSDEERTAKIRADIHTKNGEFFPLNIVLTQERRGSKWMVYSMKPPRSLETGLIENRFSVVGKGPGFMDPTNRQPAPDGESMKKMILSTLLLFNEAVQKKSFADFYASVSRAWQDQLTEKQLERAFQAFMDKNVNVAAIAEADAVLQTAPTVSTEGLLQVSGYYPTKPYRVVFALKYMYEAPTWKLFGIDVSLER